MIAKDQSRIHQFGKKVLPGLFRGSAQYAGRIWKGDIMVADIEELETMDASEIFSRNTRCKGSTKFPRRMDNSLVQSQMYEKYWWKSGPENTHFDTGSSIRGENHVDFLGETEGSLAPPHDTFPDAGEAINDFWSMSGNFIYRHHVEPKVKLYSKKRRIIPFHNEIHWCIQNYTQMWMSSKGNASKTFGTSMDQEICLFRGQVTQFTLLDEKPPDGFLWSGWRSKKKGRRGRQQCKAFFLSAGRGVVMDVLASDVSYVNAVLSSIQYDPGFLSAQRRSWLRWPSFTTKLHGGCSTSVSTTQYGLFCEDDV